MSINDMMNYDEATRPFMFLLKVSFGVMGGLVLGSLVDTTCRKLQNDDNVEWQQRSLKKSLFFFILQIILNIIILLILCVIYPSKFIKWFQLTISGALFAVLLFAVQQNLIHNSLRISYF